MLTKNTREDCPAAASLAALTIWSDEEERVYAGRDVVPGTTTASEIGDRGHPGRIWVDIDLDTDVHTWMEPWDAWEQQPTDWRGLRGVSDVLRLDLPTERTDASVRDGSLDGLLRRLQFANEFGVLRSLQPDWFGHDAPAMVMPLAGFIPASPDLLPIDDTAPGCLEFVLLRVNIAVVDDLLISVRLTDRLCSGGRKRNDGSRLKARDHYEKLPDLTVFRRFLPSNRPPTATDLGEALAVYLAGTCGCVAERARQRLRRVERDLVAMSAAGAGMTDGWTERHVLARNAEIFEIRDTLESVEEELLRLVQRLSDAPTDDVTVLRVRARYEEGLAELRSVEAEVRWAADLARDRLATLQVQHAREAEERARERQTKAEEAQRHAEQRQQKLDRIIAGLGTALVIAALVPSLFGESAKLPAKSGWDFVGMLCIMLGAALMVFWLLLTLLNGRASTPDATPDAVGAETQGGTRTRWASLGAVMCNVFAVIFVVAGIGALLWDG
jgi:hypothetical protein